MKWATPKTSQTRKRKFNTLAEREQHYSFLRARAQANYRNEPWELSLEEYMQLWKGSWHLRGRGAEDLVGARLDPELPWCVDNVELMTRIEVNRRARERKYGSQ